MNSMARNGKAGLGAFLDPLKPDRHIRPPLTQGRMAEWLCRGLQIPVQRFDSASGLQRRKTRLGADARLERALHDRTLFPLAPEPHLSRAPLQGGLQTAPSSAASDPPTDSSR